MTTEGRIDIVREPVDETKTPPKDLFVSMDRESFERSTGPSADDYRRALLQADAALRQSKPYVPVRQGDVTRRRRR